MAAKRKKPSGGLGLPFISDRSVMMVLGVAGWIVVVMLITETMPLIDYASTSFSLPVYAEY